MRGRRPGRSQGNFLLGCPEHLHPLLRLTISEMPCDVEPRSLAKETFRNSPTVKSRSVPQHRFTAHPEQELCRACIGISLTTQPASTHPVTISTMQDNGSMPSGTRFGKYIIPRHLFVNVGLLTEPNTRSPRLPMTCG
jgi:hypothetical protein